MAARFGVGLVGSGFISKTHLDALRTIPDVEVVAIADVVVEKAKEFAAANNVPRVYPSHQAMLQDKDVQAIVVGIPNCFHHDVTMDALNAGRHVICEKPLALTLEHAEEMIATAKAKGLVLGYAEELSYVPKFLKARDLMKSGGIGKPYLLRQCEKHAGPYSPWFWKPEQAGGGILMDMGCHSIECIRYLLGKPKVQWVQAHMGTYLHNEITVEEDFCLVLMGFEDGTVGQAEASWALKGGMDSTLEVFGTKGVVYADLLKGMGLRAFSEKGFKDLDEPNKGWLYPDYDWLWNNGYPQEDRNFIDCMRNGGTPEESGEDGLAVLEIMLAAYHSAGTGHKVHLPFCPKGLKVPPVDLWIHPQPGLGDGPIP